jgi:hypothetical protein
MKRRAKPSFRIKADLPQILVDNTVWRIRRRPVWNTMATEMPPYWSLKARWDAEALA